MSDRYAAFHALHHADPPLLLPNAWDAASAAALVGQGFPAIGTTSLGVAAGAGKPDGVAATRAENLALAHRLRPLPVLLTVDVEGGFADEPSAVAEYAAELAALGVVGINLEDGRPDGTLEPVGRTVEKITAVRAAVPGLFVNARTDAWWLGVPGAPTEAVRRVRAYRAAGADGVFVPAAPDDTLALLVAEAGVPLNVLYRPGGPGLHELGRLGVARVSTGSLLFRAALGAALDVTDAIRGGRAGGPAGVPSYGRVQEWSGWFEDADSR
ncbi:isocitrate lyase/phosphoenolpyruvate mutase family protein [Micromonospora sp. R77]|uniref:isocitrate lyase/PEP mutase family protein n=1 Tax=Micromonospora sp. R77 TaxID=2925836 RepID=UPI001F6051B6|nr:isocitrate lyase/phosphoenolpyruvate mutase family protein [Micromonospora sp. R77]MCI4065887.1 isocitrate lyase/phosphoenolpyruvate mutase family protein [Micromonospora sp. R77]